MDREMLEQQLTRVEGHVTIGEGHVARQRERIAELERDGHDTVEARQLLTTFEETQHLHIEHRNRLRNELTELN